MKKFTFGLMACCLTATAACGDNFATEAEKKAADNGKTTMFYERQEAAQTTSLDDDAVQSMLFVFADDSQVKSMIASGELSKKQKDKAWREMRVLNLDGKRDGQTFFAKFHNIFDLPGSGSSEISPAMAESGIESGFVTFQSDLSSSYVELSKRSGKTYSLSSQELTAEELRKGVRVEFSVADGAIKVDVKR